jgi:hypothetical protein
VQAHHHRVDRVIGHSAPRLVGRNLNGHR